MKDEVKINEGYKSIEASVQFNAIDDADNRNAKGATVKVGNQIFSDTSKYYFMQHNSTKTIQNFTDSVPVSATFSNYFTGSVNISVKCQLTNGAKQKWQQEAFKAIIDA